MVITGVLVAALILSVKTGIILGTSWLSRRAIVFVSSLFGLALFALVKIFAPHYNVLAQLLDRHTFLGAILAAILLIYLGLQGSDTEECEVEGNKKSKLRWLAFLPCPFCLGALAFSVIMLVPLLAASTTIVGAGAAVVFALLVVAVALGTRKLVGLAKFRPVVLFNQLLVLMGALTLAFSLVIPNFVQSMTMPMAPVTVASPLWLGGVISGFVVLVLAGYFQYQRNIKGR
ncbi:MAG: hypothetical protein PWQ91_996 [Eubacteriales bacterium]|nr:hypothetical protein [Eubacteriales bacterium]